MTREELEKLANQMKDRAATNLIAALNDMFALGRSGLVANRFDLDTVCIEFNGTVDFLINAQGITTHPELDSDE